MKDMTCTYYALCKKKASRGTQIRINSDILDIFFILKSQHLNNIKQ
jgi:hypothetical protein